MDSKYCARCSFYIEKEKLAYEAEIRMMQDRLTAAESEKVKFERLLNTAIEQHTLYENMYNQLRAQLAEQTTPAESVHGEASLESAIHRPECFDFAMSFLGDPEESIIRDYVLSLEKSAISKVEQVRGVGEPVYLVATGEHYGQHESYTLHDDPPALCDYEKLYRKPVPNKADVPDEPTEEMLEIGVDTLQRGFALFGENFTQIVNNVWEDMYAAALPPLKDE